MINDYSLCSEVQGFVDCETCLRNPENTKASDIYQSWIEPEIKNDECIDLLTIEEEL